MMPDFSVSVAGAALRRISSNVVGKIRCMNRNQPENYFCTTSGNPKSERGNLNKAIPWTSVAHALGDQRC